MLVPIDCESVGYVVIVLGGGQSGCPSASCLAYRQRSGKIASIGPTRGENHGLWFSEDCNLHLPLPSLPRPSAFLILPTNPWFCRKTNRGCHPTPSSDVGDLIFQTVPLLEPASWPLVARFRNPRIQKLVWATPNIFNYFSFVRSSSNRLTEVASHKQPSN